MLGTSSSIANVGDRSEERRRDFTPRDNMHIYIYNYNYNYNYYIYSICYVIVRLRRLHCSIVVNSSGQNFGLTHVMTSRIGYVFIDTSFCYCYRAARTEGTIYWC